jgi:hypothetical protein
MARDPKMKICYDRSVLRKPGSPAAVVHAMREQALLRSTGAKTPREAFHALDPRKVVPPAHMALIGQKKWPTGSSLRCRFLAGSPTQQAKVMAKAKLWEKYANLQLDFVKDDDAQVRIGFLPDQGSWSAIGQDSLDQPSFPAGTPTMNFGWLEDDTDDTEYERVVVHEFGHALGCIHEHQQPNERLQWNVEAVYEQFAGAPNFWDKPTIDTNILQTYAPTGISATVFDRDSIMLYQFPAALFLNHVGTPLNTHLSAKDEALIGQMYPRQ